MRVVNKTKKTLLASNARVADKMIKRIRGLLGKESLNPGEGLVIIPCSSINTFGVRFPLDAIFFDGNRKALKVVKNIKPNRISGWYPKARGVVELPAGTLDEWPVDPGDQLEITASAWAPRPVTGKG